MNRRWLLIILGISCTLLVLLKQFELASLKPFYKPQRTIKIERFAEAKIRLSQGDQELLELWESMLTGRSAPLNQWMKSQYQQLGLNHLFTPSGFHLSAVLSPVSKIIRNSKWQLIILLVLGIGIYCLPGLGALKRMVLIKLGQSFCNRQQGFVVALMLDVLFGSFQDGALSFTYSFLFLGIIYSGAQGATLIIWFYLAQVILAYFQGNDISLLLLLFSPILNLAFALAMPLLLVLAFPLWHWQLELGLLILKWLQWLVANSALLVSYLPMLEVHLWTILILFCGLFRKPVYVLAGIALFCGSLNLDLQKTPGLGTYDFVPAGNMIRQVAKANEEVFYYQDGKCKRRLVRGMWWETCSPLRRSMRKKLMKLSYPSSERRKSSLRG